MVRLPKQIYHVRWSPRVRQWENRLRFPGRRFVSLGDTNSKFYRSGWETVDLLDADFICDLRKECLPFESESLDAVYFSHVIEHLSAEVGLHLFQEIYRCLKTGGYCRLATPDMDLYLERYRANDWCFFLRANGEAILKRVCRGILSPESLLMHNQLVKAFASYSGRLDNGGGPIVQQQQVDSKLATMPKYEFRDWCVSLLEPGRVYAHIHLYDYDEFLTWIKAIFSYDLCVQFCLIGKPLVQGVVTDVPNYVDLLLGNTLSNCLLFSFVVIDSKVIRVPTTLHPRVWWQHPVTG